MQRDTSLSKTLLSSLEPYNKHDSIPKNVVHPFATAAPETTSLLQDLINTTDQLSNSLRLYDTAQWTGAKLPSLLRQYTSIERSSHSATRNIQYLIDSLKARSTLNYGESIPLLATAIPDWCIEQLVAWGTLVGMETFRDDSRQGGSTVMLGGKVLVIDVDFTIDRSDPLKPRLQIANVKTSNALLPGSSNASTSVLLDTFLAGAMKDYCAEMQKSDDLRDPLRAAALRESALDQLRYLVLLDGLASRKDDGGIRWFTDVDDLCPTLNDLAKGEAEAVASSLSLPIAPLDIFLLRSHSLPLPYLTIPSISFLTYLSPAAYLTLVRSSTNPVTDQTFPPVDISLVDLKNGLNILTQGVSIATLSLKKLSEAHLYPTSMSMPNVTTRPTFPLHPSASELDHSFPQLDGLGMDVNPPGLGSSPPSEPYAWVLDFTEGGKRPGVVMNQSRMKAIELAVNPLGGGDSLNAVADVLSIGSWIDLLLHPGSAITSERYTALYRSPNSLHPPLQLRLTAPEEPGYVLEQIPVHSMKEVWGILEIVREQCWLNETLLGCHWTTEGLKSEEEDIPDPAGAAEEDLEAVLSGTFTPRKIPVNVLLPSGNETDNLFGPTDMDFSPDLRPKIVMTSPERSPISGLVEITVAYDEKKPRGVSVSIQGAMGLEIKTTDMEEICRRGGTLGLPGRVWAKGHGSTI